MAKPKPADKPSGSPLERTALLARKLLAVPKAEADKVKQREQRKKQSSS